MKYNIISRRLPVLCLLILVFCLSARRAADDSSTGEGRPADIKAKAAFTVPALIVFEREVIQQTYNEEEKETQIMTYYFSVDGNFAGIRLPKETADENVSLMAYTKDGLMLLFDEKKKIITVMKMARTVGETGKMSKELVEKIKGAPLTKDKQDPDMVKSGNTKKIAGYPAVEYTSMMEGGKVSIWYAKVDFDPILIYSMGMGKMSDMHQAATMKNNPFAIAVSNKNYLLAEMAPGGKKGLETVSITKKNMTISTAAYKIRDYSNMSMGEMIKAAAKEKN